MGNRLKRAVVALLVAALWGTGFAGVPATAAPYPDRPLRLIVPWEAQSAPDQVARRLAPLLEQGLGQPVRVVNRTGGDGALGLTVIAQARPDGYTVGLATAAVSVMHAQGLVPVAAAHFRAVGQVAADPDGRWPHSGCVPGGDRGGGAEPSGAAAGEDGAAAAGWEPWWGLVVPRNTPEEAVRALEAALEAAHGNPEFHEVLRQHGLQPRWLGADAFQRLIEAGDAHVARLFALDGAP